MREILFRGKRHDNGEWVEGDLRHGGYYLNDPDIYIVVCFADTVMNYPINPETVGQYTGMLDKNGKRIFENGYMIIDKQTYKVLFDNGEYILKNIFNCDTIQLKNNSNIGVFVDEI